MIMPNGNRLSPRLQQVLDVAASIAEPGEPITPKEIAEKIGITPNNVSLLISRLRDQGLWIYAPPKPGRKPGDRSKPGPIQEERAAAKIHELLVRFPDAAARRRIIELVLGKVKGEGKPKS